MPTQKRNRITALCCAGILILFTPLPTLAFPAAEATNAIAVTEDTALFSITYRLGFLNRETRVPIHAAPHHTQPAATSVRYQIDRAGAAYAAGQSPAIILTDDPDVTVEDGYYVLESGESANFTLYSIFRPDPGTAPAFYQLQINRLPFLLIDDGAAELTTLPDHNPTDYQTPAVLLGEPNLNVSAELIEYTTSQK